MLAKFYTHCNEITTTTKKPIPNFSMFDQFKMRASLTEPVNIFSEVPGESFIAKYLHFL